MNRSQDARDCARGRGGRGRRGGVTIAGRALALLAAAAVVPLLPAAASAVASALLDGAPTMLDVSLPWWRP